MTSPTPSGGPDTVAGHFARRGDGDWEPLLQDSSPLFLAIFRDDTASIVEVLRSQPQLINGMLMLLYWGSESEMEARQVTVKRRTPLQLAAMFGSLNALNVLLSKGASVSTRVPDDDSTAIEVSRLKWYRLGSRSFFCSSWPYERTQLYRRVCFFAGGLEFLGPSNGGSHGRYFERRREATLRISPTARFKVDISRRIQLSLMST